MFFACAGLILASIDQILPDLYDNAIILGALSFVVGFLYLIDLSDPLARKIPTTTQTDATMAQGTSSMQSNVGQIQKSVKISKDVQTGTDSLPTTPQLQYNSRTNTLRSLSRQSQYNNNGHSNHGVDMHEIDIVETKNYPERQSPVFSKVKLPTEKKPTKQKDVARNYYNRGFLEPWEELESPIIVKPPSVSPSRGSFRTRSPDVYHSNTYVQAPPVDKGLTVIRKSRPVRYTYYPDYSLDEKEHEEEEQPQPIRRGYVAQAAALWDSRVSGKSVRSLRPGSTDTNV